MAFVINYNSENYLLTLGKSIFPEGLQRKQVW